MYAGSPDILKIPFHYLLWPICLDELLHLHFQLFLFTRQKFQAQQKETKLLFCSSARNLMDGWQIRWELNTQLVLGGLLHQQREFPHEVTTELVLLQSSRHHGQPDGLRHTGHGVKVADGHPEDVEW